MSYSVLHMISSKRFIVSGLTFKSLNHFEFFLCMVLGSVLISFFTCSCPVFPAPLIEEAVLSPMYVLASFIKNKVTICPWVFLRAFFPVPLIYISVFVPVPYCVDYCSFVVQSEVREPDSSSSIFLSQECFGYLGSFVFPYKLRNFLLQFCEKCQWQFDRNCTESVDCLGQYNNFHNVDSSNPRTWYISLSVCIIFNFFHQCLIVFCIQAFCLLRQVYSQVLYSFCCNGKQIGRAHV